MTFAAHARGNSETRYSCVGAPAATQAKRQTSFSYMLQETVEERFVGVPEAWRSPNKQPGPAAQWRPDRTGSGEWGDAGSQGARSVRTGAP